MKKVGVLLVVLVLLLGTVGVSYASWIKVLRMDIVVDTAKVDAHWTTGPSWTEGDPKGASSIECFVDPRDPQKLWVIVHNAFPCVHYYQDIDFHNSGSIPFHVGPWRRPDLPPCMTLDLPEWESNQLHPCEMLYGTIHIHFCQETEQGGSYHFEVELPVTQYNMVGG